MNDFEYLYENLFKNILPNKELLMRAVQDGYTILVITPHMYEIMDRTTNANRTAAHGTALHTATGRMFKSVMSRGGMDSDVWTSFSTIDSVTTDAVLVAKMHGNSLVAKGEKTAVVTYAYVKENMCGIKSVVRHRNERVLSSEPASGAICTIKFNDIVMNEGHYMTQSFTTWRCETTTTSICHVYLSMLAIGLKRAQA
ncbi:hypothetical protein BST61_g11447 [Cercospora zeina]